MAQNAPETFTCTVSDPNLPRSQKSQIIIQLQQPTVTRRDEFPETPVWVENQLLLNGKELPQWKLDSKSCQISSDLHEAQFGSQYYYGFDCPEFYGSFFFNFRRMDGFYQERLKGTIVTRHIEFVDCESDKPADKAKESRF